MTIIPVDINGAYAYISNSISYAELYQIREKLKIKVPGYRYAKSYKNGKWDGYFRYVDVINRSIPVGIIDINWGNIEFQVQSIQGRQLKFDIDSKFTLRTDYQLPLVEKCIKKERGLVHVATNGGKTYIIAGILSAIKSESSILVCIHQNTIKEQLCVQLEELLGEKIGVIDSSTVNIRRVTVGMVLTLVNRYKALDTEIYDYINNLDMFISDEVHHATGEQIQFLFKSISSRYRFGFSGTIPPANTYKGLQIRQYIGDVITTVTNKELIALGYSSPPIINLIEVDSSELFNEKDIISNLKSKYEYKNEGYDIYNGRIKALAYKQIETICLYNNEYKNKIICDICKKHKDINILIIVERIEQGQVLSKLLKCDFISGETQTEIRNEILEKFKKSEITRLIVSTIAEEGISINSIDCVILTGIRKSPRQTLQRIGRGLRMREGKDCVLIYDFIELGHHKLLEQCKHRIQLYKKEGFSINWYDNR